VFSKLGIECIP